MKLNTGDQSNINNFPEKSRDFDELLTQFYERGCYSVVMPIIFRRNFQNFCKRHKRIVKLQYKSYRNKFFKFPFLVYSFWCMVVLDMFEPRDNGYLAGCDFFGVFLPNIKGIKGEEVDETNYRVTFYPRT